MKTIKPLLGKKCPDKYPVFCPHIIEGTNKSILDAKNGVINYQNTIT